jgi:hypothetical protein
MLLPASSSERRLPTGKDAAMAWVAAVLAAVAQNSAVLAAVAQNSAVLAAVAQNSAVLAEMVERAAFLDDTGPARGEKPLLLGG